MRKLSSLRSHRLHGEFHLQHDPKSKDVGADGQLEVDVTWRRESTSKEVGLGMVPDERGQARPGERGQARKH